MLFEQVKKEKIDTVPFVKNSIIEGDKVMSFQIEHDGKLYLISQTDYSGLRISTPKADTIEKRYQVSGKINGLEIKPMTFKEKSKAAKMMATDDGLTVIEVDFNVTANGEEDDYDKSDFPF